MLQDPANIKDLDSKIYENKDISEKSIPSYVGVSCAVSGYRALNKYDAAIREGLQAQDSPTRIVLPRGPDGKTLPISFDILNADFHHLNKAPSGQSPILISKFCNESDNIVSLANQEQSSSNMNGHNNSSLQCTTRIVKVQKFTTIKTDVTNGSTITENTVIKNNGMCEDNVGSSKSFVQQRIERLYGPGALGMAFRTRRAMLERHNDSQQVQEISFEANESPTNLPSVFRHLRPEFRHQLPLKSKQKIGWNNHENSSIANNKHGSLIMNGNRHPSENRIIHIPIQMEDSNVSRTIDIPDFKVGSNVKKDVDVNEKSNCISNSNQMPDYKDKINFDKAEQKNATISDDSKLPLNMKPLKHENKDGHYFLKIVEGEVAILMSQVEKIDKDLEDCGEFMSEEVKGKVFAATGKTRLLISQKVEQFKGLCHKNIIKSSAEEFPTTNEDLAGFWDMVHLQVDHVKDLLSEVVVLKQNNWQDVPKQESDVHKKSLTKVRKLKNSSNAPSEEEKQKEVARLKANDDRRKAMREALNAKRKAASSSTKHLENDQIEIFVPNK